MRRIGFVAGRPDATELPPTFTSFCGGGMLIVMPPSAPGPRAASDDRPRRPQRAVASEPA